MHQTIHTHQPPSPARVMQRVLWGAYALIVTGVAIHLAVAAFTAESQPDWSGLGWTPPNYHPPVWVIALWSVGTLTLIAVPWRPIIALLVYIVMAYGVTRYNAEYEFMLHLHVLQWVCGLSVVGWTLWLFIKKNRPAVASRAITWIMIAFVTWLGVCALAAVIQGRPWNPLIEHHPIMYLEGLILFLLPIPTTPDRIWPAICFC